MEARCWEKEIDNRSSGRETESVMVQTAVSGYEPRQCTNSMAERWTMMFRPVRTIYLPPSELKGKQVPGKLKCVLVLEWIGQKEVAKAVSSLGLLRQRVCQSV